MPASNRVRLKFFPVSVGEVPGKEMLTSTFTGRTKFARSWKSQVVVVLVNAPPATLAGAEMMVTAPEVLRIAPWAKGPMPRITIDANPKTDLMDISLPEV